MLTDKPQIFTFSKGFMNKFIPRQYSLVRFQLNGLDSSWWDKYPFEPEGTYIFLGEIPNMPGHCVVIEHKTGKIHSGYHIENFVEIPEEDT